MIGMLWFDNSKADLAARVTRAVDYYREKYGAAPNVCYLRPYGSPLPAAVGDVRLVETHQIQPCHFLVGVADESQ